MQFVTKLCRALTWVTLISTTGVQVLAAIGMYLNDKAGKLNPLFLIAATAVMVLSVVLFFVLRRGKLFPLIGTAVAGIAFVVLALIMMQVYPVVTSVEGISTGISLWDAIFRHMTPILIPVFLFPLWWQFHEDWLAEKNAVAEASTPSYFDILAESAAMHVDDDQAKLPKPKRSVRNRMRKEEDK